MSGSDQYIPALDRFRSAMETELAKPKNVAKSSWLLMTDGQLIARLLEETAELIAVLDADSHSDLLILDQQVIKEAADVANFAMMIADKRALNQGTST